MKIKFVQTGGFAGLTKKVEIDTDDISEEDANLLKILIEQVKFFDQHSRDDQPMPDVEQFFITVEKTGQSHTVSLNALNVPEDMKALIDNLQKRAKYKR